MISTTAVSSSQLHASGHSPRAVSGPAGCLRTNRLQKKNRLYLLERFWAHSKTESKVQRAPTYPLSPHTHSVPQHQHPHRSSAFATADKPTLAHHYRPESMVYIRVHSSNRLSTPGAEYLSGKKTGGAWLLVPNTLLNSSA